MPALETLTLKSIAAGLAAGEFSSRDLTDAYLARIEQAEPALDAFLHIAADSAREDAVAADAARREGRGGALLGVPLGLKDVLCTRGLPTTCGSRILEGFVPPYDATAVARLRQAGAVFLGKQNMDEFAMGSSTENSGYKPTRNPWDRGRTPGGSSGGSAAAVAALECPAAIGSDTGGSIRQPAAFCGIVGLKPTYGRVSRYGLVAYGSSLDQIGPLTRTVEDAAILLGVIAGHDPLDSTCAALDVPDYTAELGGGIAGLRVGLPREFFIEEGMHPEVKSTVRAAIDELDALGAEVIEVELPHTDYGIAAYYLIATSEASSNLARYDGAHYGWRAAGTDNIIDMFSETRTAGFGDEVKRRIMLGTYALSAGFYDAYYLKALKVRTLIRRDFERAFEQVDVIASPVAPTPPFKLGEKTDDPLEMYLIDAFTCTINLAGLPAISVPCGFTGEGLPIGLQLIGPWFQEARILRAAHTYEQSQAWWRKVPPLG